MKLRNKKTGEIVDLAKRGLLKSDNDDHIVVYPEGTLKYYNYFSLADLIDEWEDYKPTEPRMKGFRVWSNYWKKYATEAELYMDGSVDAIFEDADGVPHHENTDLVIEFDTGLKDKNGKEVYEGDIVKYACTRCNYIVAYRKYDASFVLENDDREEIILFQYNQQSDYEILGNIHENPELLEEE